MLAIVLLHKTPYGRKLYSVGINEEASRFSGINTGRVTFSVYLISAVIAAVSGSFLLDIREPASWMLEPAIIQRPLQQLSSVEQPLQVEKADIWEPLQVLLS